MLKEISRRESTLANLVESEIAKALEKSNESVSHNGSADSQDLDGY